MDWVFYSNSIKSVKHFTKDRRGGGGDVKGWELQLSIGLMSFYQFKKGWEREYKSCIWIDIKNNISILIIYFAQNSIVSNPAYKSTMMPWAMSKRQKYK